MADHKEPSGSPDGEPVYLTIGFLRRPHGLRGEIMMDLHTDFPERMKSGRKLLVGGDYKPVTLAGARPHQVAVLPAFGGDCTPEHPLGATTVSTEGACAADYRYGRHLSGETVGWRRMRTPPWRGPARSR